MNTCDKCGARGPEVTIGDHCPECGQLVGWPVPGMNAKGLEIEGYDVEAADSGLADAIHAVAERNFNTLMRRKRVAERAAGFEAPAAETEEANDSPAEPPNADPAAATDPSVQPQPNADSDQG